MSALWISFFVLDNSELGSAVPPIVGYWATSLASTHYMSVAPPHGVVTTKNFSRHYWIFPQEQTCPLLENHCTRLRCNNKQLPYHNQWPLFLAHTNVHCIRLMEEPPTRAPLSSMGEGKMEFCKPCTGNQNFRPEMTVLLLLTFYQPKHITGQHITLRAKRVSSHFPRSRNIWWTALVMLKAGMWKVQRNFN